MRYKFILVLFITGLLLSCNRNNRIDNEDLSGIIICKDELTQGKKPYLYHISRQD